MSLLLLFGEAQAGQVVTPPPTAPAFSGSALGLWFPQGFTRADLLALGLTEEEIKKLLALGWLFLSS